MVRWLLSWSAIFAAAGCAAAAPVASRIPDSDLLSGAALFGEAPKQAPFPREEIFALDAEMRAFVREHVDGASAPDARLKSLLSGMERRGLFSLDYDAGVTQTATDTFHRRAGNCLSFTVLFVALAREAGLRASYQMVDIPPTRSTEADLILMSNHINALVKTGSSRDYVVDFNLNELKGKYQTRAVNDQYALALFYSNNGVDALLRDDHATSFVHFRAAIEAFPTIAGPWVNLGLLYARAGRYEHAEAAYLRALAIDRRNRSALANLARAYAASGDHERAAMYEARAGRGRRQNRP
jgi:tetratricopeptide (TPR) repeat protein